MATAKKVVPLEAFVASFKDEENPTGIYRALGELKRRGVILTYMTLSRWLDRKSEPMIVWCQILERAGVDMYHLRDVGAK